MTSGSMVLRIAVLTALILGFVNGLTPDQPNVCSKRIIVKTPVTREVTKQERIHVCDQDPFLCRWKTVFVKVNVTEIVDVPTTVYECCLGYKERRGVCQAQCDPECEHGACLQPNKCHCDPGFMGDYCQSSKCDTECQHGTCVQPNTCHCDTGYMGDYCQSECAVGTYGKDCTSACTCDEYQYCHHVMGCVQCPDGTYGKDCTSVCKCDESQYCHHAMGCVHDLTTAYQGGTKVDAKFDEKFSGVSKRVVLLFVLLLFAILILITLAILCHKRIKSVSSVILTNVSSMYRYGSKSSSVTDALDVARNFSYADVSSVNGNESSVFGSKHSKKSSSVIGKYPSSVNAKKSSSVIRKYPSSVNAKKSSSVFQKRPSYSVNAKKLSSVNRKHRYSTKAKRSSSAVQKRPRRKKTRKPKSFPTKIDTKHVTSQIDVSAPETEAEKRARLNLIMGGWRSKKRKSTEY